MKIKFYSSHEYNDVAFWYSPQNILSVTLTSTGHFVKRESAVESSEAFDQVVRLDGQAQAEGGAAMQQRVCDDCQGRRARE